MQNSDPSGRTWTILDIIRWTTAYFKSHGIDSPRITAEILLAHVLHLDRIDLYLRHDQPLNRNELSGFKDLMQRRVKREPVAYIVGKKEFWSLDICVSRHCLIPRPETECLVETSLSVLGKALPEHLQDSRPAILEVGTGSGAVIIAMARERSDGLFFASDYSVDALLLAQKNAQTQGLDHKIHFFAGDWFSPLKCFSCFNLILSNPPYIRTDLLLSLEPEIYRYEPRTALDGGADGLCSITKIIDTAHIYLKNGGFLILEIGSDQKEAVEQIGRKSGRYDEVFVTRDYAGCDRVAALRKGQG